MTGITGKIKFIPRAHKAHPCARCGTEIPVGSDCYKVEPRLGEEDPHVYLCSACKLKNDTELLHT